VSRATQRTAAEAGQQIADALAARGIPYALGGALALGVAGVPRGTRDVDVNVFVEPPALDPVFEALESLGVALDRPACSARAARDGMFVGHWEGMRIDVFVPSIPFSEEAARTAVSVTIDGWTGRFLSPEAICLFKLLFFRPKDVADLGQLVAVRQEALDRVYVRRWIVEMMGEGDPRVAKWDELSGSSAVG
jgi:hypothetical protein